MEIILIYAIILLIQQFKSDLKAGRIAATTAFVILFSLVGYTPKWLKDDKSKDDDTPPKHRNIIF